VPTVQAQRTAPKKVQRKRRRIRAPPARTIEPVKYLNHYPHPILSKS